MIWLQSEFNLRIYFINKSSQYKPLTGKFNEERQYKF